jgi:hypothetical protein
MMIHLESIREVQRNLDLWEDGNSLGLFSLLCILAL